MSATGEELVVLEEIHLGETNVLAQLEDLALNPDDIPNLRSGSEAAVDLQRHPRAHRILGEERHGAHNVDQGQRAATFSTNNIKNSKNQENSK